MRTNEEQSARLEGLDLARYLAFAGMVFVNFRLAMQVDVAGNGWLQYVFTALEGKASATFVVLAGLGLSLATRSMNLDAAQSWTVRRAAFLLVVGLVNLWVFPADILHYYAIYFILALPLLNARSTTYAIVTLSIVALSCWAQLSFNYSQGWDWSTLHYADLWTVHGAMRNLLFNGFHPVLPWLGYLVFGLLLGRMPLHSARAQVALIVIGSTTMACAAGISHLLQDATFAWLMGTTPLPPGPIYMLAGLGCSLTVIGACLLVTRRASFQRWLAPAGKMTLSLYLAHIVLGMGILEGLGLLQGTATLEAVGIAACAFLLFGTVFAGLWSRRFQYGPIETCMRFACPPSHSRN